MIRTLRKDRHWWRSRTGDGLVAGTPGTFFRVTASGASVLDAIESGSPVEDSPLVDRLIAAGAVHPLPGAPVAAGDVTVVIPAHVTDAGGGERLQRLVDSLSPLAVIVVDDASPEPTVTTGCRVIRRSENGGPGAARNDGIANVTTPFVAFVDDDVRTDAAAILGLTGHFTDPNVAFVAPRIVTADGRDSVTEYETVRSTLDMGTSPARVRPRSIVPYVPTAVFVARTAAAARGFDTAMRFGEDVEFVWRTSGDTAQCRYEPTVECSHPARQGWRAFALQRFRYGRSAADIDARIPWSVAPVQGSIFHVLPVTAVLAGQLFLAVNAAGVSLALTFFVLRSMGLSARDRLSIARLTILTSSRHVATAVTREWWPVFVVGSWFIPLLGFTFWFALAGLIAVDFVRLRPRSLATFVPLRVLDNLAYGAGVWTGALRTRSVRCLLPKVSVLPRRGG